MSASNRTERPRPERRRQHKLRAELSQCCYRDPQRGLQLFLCSQFSTNGTAAQVIGGAYCCKPSRDQAYCCTKQEFMEGIGNGNEAQPRCGRWGGGRRFHRRHMVPRVALTVGSVLLLIIIAIIIYFCLKKKLLSKKREGRVHGWLVPNGGTRPESMLPAGAAVTPSGLITPYQQTTGVYSLPASNHPVQYIGGSQCPLREYGPLQPAYPGRQFGNVPPAALPGVTEVR
ncbi:uncharacterized protein LOC119101193 [Pollicipes pollicipes]|uniref:uncharacterized protein LOC119101193 n=1 Tax=Pollicipes pollicipes TaxID=41117 RepID=UPI00188596E9|nr:uncharacterized protein LOC119101193 [Pollicipes pollicipes]